LGEQVQERDLEKALINHIRDFLLELGIGFAFVGSQYHLELGGQDFYIDLLFYHLRLRCFVVIDLKVEEFKPEFSGKMNFYVAAVDDLLRQAEDKPTIGIILCKSKNQTIVEYALRDMNKPIGVSTYQSRETLPDNLQGNLPTIEEFEAELNNVSLE
jgi:YhcG PDDEXK nuclease domain